MNLSSIAGGNIVNKTKKDADSLKFKIDQWLKESADDTYNYFKMRVIDLAKLPKFDFTHVSELAWVDITIDSDCTNIRVNGESGKVYESRIQTTNDAINYNSDMRPDMRAVVNKSDVCSKYADQLDKIFHAKGDFFGNYLVDGVIRSVETRSGIKENRCSIYLNIRKE